MKSIERTMLTSTIGFSRDLIKVGERIVSATETLGADDHASIAERTVRKVGLRMTAAGERLELSVNSLGMRLGYRDGEVSGLVATAV